MTNAAADAELFQAWSVYVSRSTWTDILRRGADGAHAERAHTALGGLPELGELAALAANGELVERLTHARWWVILTAREKGTSWSDIAEALNMHEDQIRSWYQQVISELESSPVHDAERARAVL